MKYKNETHRVILESIEKSGNKLKQPIMLTANQFEKDYAVSLNWTGTKIRIPKSKIDKNELKEITNEDYGGKIVLNDVWEATL